MTVTKPAGKDPQGETQWDALLTKYVRVWIWSAILGANAGLSYSYIGLQTDRMWGTLGAVLLLVMAFGVIAAFASWWALLTHLRVAILPVFFRYSHPGTSEDPNERERRAARTLILSYQNFVVAASARLLFALIEFALQTVR